MEPIYSLLLGAGNRGTHVYAEFARQNPSMLKIAAVAEPNTARREKIRDEHRIPTEFIFTTWEEAFERLPPQLDAVMIATQDKMHLEPIMAAMERKLHILCEKPIVPSLAECRAIERASAGYDKVFMIAHVLKYTAFFSKIQELLQSGKIGKLIGIDLIEHVGHIHHSHSFVRGNWRNSAESSPMILAKSCHDMDILYWLAGSPCESLSSNGGLYYFKKENAPADAPKRCLEGCPNMIECPYYAPKIYLCANIGWPVNVITTDLSMEGRLAALETGAYGRCVFHCDNDVVDHQTVSMRFANGVMANFTMSAFSAEIHRSIKLFGTAGEICGDMEENTIQLKEFTTGNTELIEPGKTAGGHSGGDRHLITDFACMVRDGSGSQNPIGKGRNMIRNSFESHYMAFAAEQSRLEGARTIWLAEFKRNAGTESDGAASM
ncbi:MAG: Gfo/Idh/MocA family oxidoreductase [Treponema sp.]|nr:Gfo/Idh/MocA family oxidoreductase [Treponema sp.]